MTNNELQSELRKHSGDITVVLAVTDLTTGEVLFGDTDNIVLSYEEDELVISS